MAVISLFVAALFVARPSADALVRIAPEQGDCEWNVEAFTPLWPPRDPSGSAQIIAANASLWLRWNAGVSAIGVINPELRNGDGVVLATTRTDLSIPTGALVELKPREPLEAGKRYILHFENETIDVVASGPIFGAPDPIPVTSMYSIEDAAAFEACLTSGVVVETAPSSTELRLFIDPRGEVLAVSNTATLIVVGTPGDNVCGEVVAMDSVGRRSEPSAQQCAVAGMPTVPDGQPRREKSTLQKLGCASARGAIDPLLLAIFGAAGLLYRSRRTRS